MVADNMPARVGGRYELVREIGAGGMGRVYQAVDTKTGRAVAAKVMVVHSDNNLEALIRFHQEGALLSTLKHPNIVEVYGIFLEEQASSIIMELLEGRSLAQIMAAEHLSLERAKQMMMQLCSALAHAHLHGIIHRDVKPGNIMLVGNDNVKVTDFGIARILNSGSTLKTMTGTSIGTPLYMSPEQVEGRPIDGRTDIYSAGVVLYHIVTGRPPFEGDDPISVAFKHVHKAPQLPSLINADVPPDWEKLILRALAKDPADRFQSADAMYQALAVLSSSKEADDPDTARATRDTGDSSDPLPAQVAPDTRIWPEARLAPGGPGAPADSGRAEGVDDVARSLPDAVARPEPEPARGTRRTVNRSLVGALIAAVLVLVIAVVAFTALRGRGTTASPGATPTTAPVATTAPSVIPSGHGLRVIAWGSEGSRPRQFKSPSGATFDRRGNIYVVDTGNDRIQKFSPAGTFLRAWGTRGSRPGQFQNPQGVAVDRRDNVYIADTGNNRVQKFSATGAFLTAWTRVGTTSFDRPTAVAVGGSNLYVVDAGHNRIQEMSPNGTPVNCWGDAPCRSAQFQHPNAVAIDSHDDIYVVDTLDHTVQVFDQNGEGLNVLGSKGSKPGQFLSPKGITFDAQGHLYVTDTGNNRIQEFSSDGTFITQWGNQTPGFVTFNHPTSARVDRQGRIFVVDSGNNRIERLSPRPTSKPTT
ncbi:MAG: hypothetical protein NVS4B2_16260 [Chloroflexota bacterium]